LEDNQAIENDTFSLPVAWIQIPHWKIIKNNKEDDSVRKEANSNSSLEDNQVCICTKPIKAYVIQIPHWKIIKHRRQKDPKIMR